MKSSIFKMETTIFKMEMTILKMETTIFKMEMTILKMKTIILKVMKRMRTKTVGREVEAALLRQEDGILRSGKEQLERILMHQARSTSVPRAKKNWQGML
jgi:AAA+ ATPase superfamily predicted ATPase